MRVFTVSNVLNGFGGRSVNEPSTHTERREERTTEEKTPVGWWMDDDDDDAIRWGRKGSFFPSVGSFTRSLHWPPILVEKKKKLSCIRLAEIEPSERKEMNKKVAIQSVNLIFASDWLMIRPNRFIISTQVTPLFTPWLCLFDRRLLQLKKKKKRVFSFNF